MEGSLVNKEAIYYRFPFPGNGVTFVLEVLNGSVVCYASNTFSNPHHKYNYTWSIEASYYNDSYIDPSTIQVTVGPYIYVGIVGNSNSSSAFFLNATSGDSATAG